MVKKGHPSAKCLCLRGLLIAVLLLSPWTLFATEPINEADFFHRVSPGESLSKIASLYFPLAEAHTVVDFVRKIQERNGLKGTVIHPNQRLLIPVVRSTPVISKTIPKERTRIHNVFDKLLFIFPPSLMM